MSIGACLNKKHVIRISNRTCNLAAVDAEVMEELTE